jgi:hypothetical protein
MRIRSKQRTKHLKMAPTEPRVFVGLFEIAGYYGRIVDHLRETGYPISFVELSPHRFKYPSERPRSDYKHASFLQNAVETRSSVLSQIKFRLVGIHLFLWAMLKHDVFVFVAGRSFSKYNLDVLFLRMLGKRVVSAVWHGSEARPAYMDGALWELASNTPDPIHFIYKTARRQRMHMRRLERFSSDLIAHPLTSHFLTEASICSTFIGIPPPPTLSTFDPELPLDYPLVIAHAPSNRFVKGSDLIHEIINRISSDLPNLIEYREIHGVSNNEVLILMQNSDLLIDQLYSDTIWPGIGVEAATCGLPMIVGNTGLNLLSKIVPSSSLPPAFVTTPADLEGMIRDLLQDLTKVQRMSSRAYDFVCQEWSVELVSKRFLQVAVDDYPNSWCFDPNSIQYVYGGGISPDQMRRILVTGTARYGLDFLSLHHRPDLVKELSTTFLN